jgi:hypothetical protein
MEIGLALRQASQSRQPLAATLNAIAVQYLDGSGHDLEKNEFENSPGELFRRRTWLRRGQHRITQKKIYAAALNASLLFCCRSHARRLAVVLFDHVKFVSDLAAPERC